MDRKDKEPKGTAATASKMAAADKKTEGESPSPASITPQQSHGAVGAPQQNKGATGQQQNQGSKNQQNTGGGQDLLQQAKQTTNEVVNQVQQQASSQFNRQKETAASELSTVVNAVRRFGESLNNEGQGPIARMAAQYGDKAADGLDRVARYLHEQDPKRLLNDVQSFGRRQPALFIGGAFLFGLAGARIIKSSMDAASTSTNTGTQRSMNTGNTGTRSSANRGSQQQPFTANVPRAQQPSPPPNRAN